MLVAPVLCQWGEASTNNEKQVKCGSSFEIEVDILGTPVKVNIQQSSSVSAAVDSAMDQLQIWIPDFYVRSPRRVLQMDSMIGNLYKLVVIPRLRGGGDGPSASAVHKVALSYWIAQLKSMEGNKWFEKVIIPRSLLRVGQVETWLVLLGSDALLVLRMILDLLERAHSSGNCYEGLFNLDQIYFVPMHGILVMDDEIRPKRLHHDGYKADLLTVVEKLLWVHFMFAKGDGRVQFPAYIKELESQTLDLKKKDMYCFSEKRRSLVYNNPATWSSAKRISIFTLTNQFFKRLPMRERGIFMKAMSEQYGSFLFWHLQVIDKGAAEAMVKVFSKQFWDGSTMRAKSYSRHFMGLVDFARCVIIHAMDAQVSLVAVDAAVYMFWTGLLQSLHTFLTVYYNPKSKNSISNKGKGQAIIFREDTLPIKDDLEVHEIFGLPTEPKN